MNPSSLPHQVTVQCHCCNAMVTAAPGRDKQHNDATRIQGKFLSCSCYLPGNRFKKAKLMEFFPNLAWIINSM